MDDLNIILQGEVDELLVADDNMFWLVNDQSCDSNSAILKMNGKMVFVTHNDETISLEEISSYNPELYCHVIKPSKGERIVFRKVLYNDSGVVEGLEFGWGTRYLFIFASEHNLIITKSVVDLHGNITWDEIPAFDDSVLFDG
jgi:hypothetical protein